MKRHFIPLVILTQLFLSAMGAAESSRTWTNQEGNTMTAELTAVDDGHAVFRRHGQIYRYPIDKLSPEDQERVLAFTEQSRPRASDGPDRGPVPAALEGHLVQWDGRRLAAVSGDAMEGKKLFAFYYSAGWCPPCRQFTPGLVAFYHEVKEKHPEFEIILISNDRRPADMQKYMADYQIPWPAVRHDRTERVDLLRLHAAPGIPNLVFLDSSGKVLSRTFVDGRYRGPSPVLAEIREYLARN